MLTVFRSLRFVSLAAASGVPQANAADGAAPSRGARAGAADEYLPPNKILFIQNMPESTTREVLEGLFKQYPGFQEVRTVPAKRTIAFVEYEDETSSSAARDALFNAQIEGTPIKVRFLLLLARPRILLTPALSPLRLHLQRRLDVCNSTQRCRVFFFSFFM